MDTSLREYNKRNNLIVWRERIAACRSSGLTVRAWCAENGVSYKSYYRWQNEIFKIAQEQQNPQFAEIPQEVREGPNPCMPMPQSIVAIVRNGELSVEIQAGADTAVIRTIIEALKSC